MRRGSGGRYDEGYGGHVDRRRGGKTGKVTEVGGRSWGIQLLCRRMRDGKEALEEE